MGVRVLTSEFTCRTLARKAVSRSKARRVLLVQLGSSRARCAQAVRRLGGFLDDQTGSMTWFFVTLRTICTTYDTECVQENHVANLSSRQLRPVMKKMRMHRLDSLLVLPVALFGVIVKKDVSTRLEQLQQPSRKVFDLRTTRKQVKQHHACKRQRSPPLRASFPCARETCVRATWRALGRQTWRGIDQLPKIMSCSCYPYTGSGSVRLDMILAPTEQCRTHHPITVSEGMWILGIIVWICPHGSTAILQKGG